MLRLYDTATREVRELALSVPGKVSIYLCGPTVYGPPHLGHGRATLEYDILRRYLTWSGLEVRFVSNITDIEDKIIDRAQREGRPWNEITTHYEQVWWDTMDALDFERPTDTPHATDYVDEMVALIEELIERGAAYSTADGIYLSVESVEGYGLLAHQSLDDMRSGGGERVVVGAELKRHPADFVLWKLAKPGEPSWPSPWGDGRPGWHSECVVMSLGLLGEGFDLHCGGQDLRFPHHENERAQAVAVGKDFAKHWMHNGFVVDAEGEKMSKSLGNVSSLADLVEHYDPRAYRMALLQAHYRSPISINDRVLSSAATSLAGLDAFASRTSAIDDSEADPDVIAAFREAMDDDLDTPRATAIMFDTVRRANIALDTGDPSAPALVSAVREISGAFGLVIGSRSEIPDEVLAQAADLDAARRQRDYATADAIRAALQADGWTVETTPDGTTVRR
ncbi:MAG: cysteine--tRNA ligase [Ilumatobacter coccineus]|uniref:Cysteine--tRNA ligase n=1 Tax=Ilumatobacter coccineus TaxID=467094 RepID=A0A2G6KFK4_9ACTN|nr:MAG: cysteine--tRNA ligase [Ilumatobacter coccineus]